MEARVLDLPDYNLDDVVDEFFAKLDMEVERHRELIDTLPRLWRCVFSRDNAFIHVSVLWEPLDGWHRCADSGNRG